MSFKPRGKGKSANDLMGLLVNSKLQTDNNAAYQTIFGLITVVSQLADSTKSGLEQIKAEVDSIDTSEADQIPPFFFMGSS